MTFWGREKQLRVDGGNRAFGSSAYEHCCSMLDGWDAMEGSVSGGGCRPSINATFYGNALGIAALATELGQTNLASNFTARATAMREMYARHLCTPTPVRLYGFAGLNGCNRPGPDTMCTARAHSRTRTHTHRYLRLLWNPTIDSFAVWKDGSPAKRGPHNATNGIPFGFPKWICGSGAPNGVGSEAEAPSQPLAGEQRPPFGDKLRGARPPLPVRPEHCPKTITNCSWPCNETVGVRELLGLGPPWHFEVPPVNDSTKHQKSWAQLFDDEGFQASVPPTTPCAAHPAPPSSCSGGNSTVCNNGIGLVTGLGCVCVIWRV